MSSITTRDGATIHYKDWEQGHPLVFSHGWPLNADAWEDAMFYFAARGYRCIAADRRGHGRSSPPWNGNDLDSYADDLAELVGSLDLKGAILIGHSTGGGEVARYIGRHGTARVAAAILVSDITPLMLKTDANPQGTRVPPSIGFGAPYAPIERNSIAISPSRFTARTGAAHAFRKRSKMHSGTNR